MSVKNERRALEQDAPQTSKSQCHRTAPATPAQESELPDWWETPDELQYELTVWNSNRCAIQEVVLTREEFESVKAHVAKLRGFTVIDVVIGDINDAEAQAEKEDFDESEVLARTIVQIRANARGVATPLEELLSVLVADYAKGQATHNWVIAQFEEYKENFEFLQHSVAKFVEQGNKLTEAASAA